MSREVVIWWAVWFASGAALAPISYVWWMRRYGRRWAAITCALLTFLAPPSIIWELTR